MDSGIREPGASEVTKGDHRRPETAQKHIRKGICRGVLQYPDKIITLHSNHIRA